MPMKNPVHPGALAKANLDELNLSVAEAAKTMKITRQQLHNVMQGRSAVTPQMALRFEKAFGGGAELWLRMRLPRMRRPQVRARRNRRRLGRHPPSPTTSHWKVCQAAARPRIRNHSRPRPRHSAR